MAYIKFSKCLYLNIKMRHYLIKTLSLSNIESKIKHFVHFLSVKMKEDIMKTHRNSKLLTSRKKESKQTTFRAIFTKWAKMVQSVYFNTRKKSKLYC